MNFDTHAEQIAKAKIPHELFLTNIVANHVLWFVASLGILNSFWQPLALVPVISAIVLLYTLNRARKERVSDNWFSKCHWQLAARRSKAFIAVIALMSLLALSGWVAHQFWGVDKVTIYALIGGIGQLPLLFSIIALVIMEAESLDQATMGKLPKGVCQCDSNQRYVVA